MGYLRSWMNYQKKLKKQLTSEHAYESKTKPSGMWEYNLKTKMLESRAGISSDNEINHVSYPAEKQSDITGKKYSQVHLNINWLPWKHDAKDYQSPFNFSFIMFDSPRAQGRKNNNVSMKQKSR